MPRKGYLSIGALQGNLKGDVGQYFLEKEKVYMGSILGSRGR
jgi:hypothetical protein